MFSTITLAKVRLKKTCLSSEFRDILFERTFARVGAARHATARFLTTNGTKNTNKTVSGFAQTASHLCTVSCRDTIQRVFSPPLKEFGGCLHLFTPFEGGRGGCLQQSPLRRLAETNIVAL